MSNETAMNEMALIGCALLEAGRVMPMLMEARVGAEWFGDVKCRTAWRVLRKLWDEGSAEATDVLTFADAVKRVKPEKGEEDTAELEIGWVQKLIDDTPTVAHTEHYLGIVRNQYMVRKGRSLARTFATELDMGPAVAIQKAQRALVEIMSEANGSGDVSVSVTGEQVMEKFREAHQIRMVEKRMDYCPGIPLPWKVMTANYNGLQPGLHVLAARPSTGKTALVGNMMRWWCEGMGLHVGMNSMDMEPKQLHKRLICEKSRVSLAKAEFGTTSERDLARLEEAAMKQVAAWPLHVTVRRDLEAFRSWCIMRKMKGELDVVVVDFMQLMDFDGCWRMSTDDRVGRISGTLKAIGNDLEVPVVALSQLNRQCEEDGGREPQLSDLRGSGAIEQDAFTVMFLHTDPAVRGDFEKAPPIALAPFGASEEARKYTAKQIRPVHALIKKNQNGRTGRIPLVLFPNYFLFMLGDYMAEPRYETSADGQRKKGAPYYGEQFVRVLPDWREDPMEAALGKAGGLVTEYRDGE